MTNPKSVYPHETRLVGKTKEDQQRNAELLSGYDYDKYATALTGFTGQDLQRAPPAGSCAQQFRGSMQSGRG